MIVDERLTAFIHSLDRPQPGVTEDIAREAREDGVPIIRPEMAALLRVLILTKHPAKILEIGAATGYSSVMMAECAGEETHITTIENYEKRIPVCRANIVRAGMEQRITLIEGDANDILPTLEGGYDMIFMDAAKGQYINFLPHVLRLLAPEGLLVSDNVLQEGSIIESRYAVTRRNRTIHSRMREYLHVLKNTQELETCVLTVGDGVSVSVRRKERKDQ